MAKKRGLGRGLDALLGHVDTNNDLKTKIKTKEKTPIKPRHLPVERIQAGQYQMRRHFDQTKLQELADSIQAQGLVQPIIVRPISSDKYEIIAGERRWRAVQLNQMNDIAVVIHDVTDKTAMAMGLIENIQRDDLNPLEEAAALARLIDEFKLTHQQIAEAVGKSRTSVSNLLRLLDLEPAVKDLVENRSLEMGHARTLLALKSGEQIKAADEVAKQGMSVRETEKYVKTLLGKNNSEITEKTTIKKVDPDVQRLENSLGEKLGAKVLIQQSGKGRGKLVINYNSLDELDGIIDHIN